MTVELAAIPAGTAPVRAAAQAQARLAAVPGVRGVQAVSTIAAYQVGPDGKLPKEPVSHVIVVADCAALREIARLDRCADGDTFIADDPTTKWDDETLARPGTRLIAGPRDIRYGPDGRIDPANATHWALPPSARTVTARPDAAGVTRTGPLATPAAVDADLLRSAGVTAYLRVDLGERDVDERIRNAAAAIDPTATVNMLATTEETPRFAGIRRALFIGVVVTLLLIGVSLLVTSLEQLRERRRLLAVLIAFGTRRGTLLLSVLWQTAVPVFLGLALAMAAGAGLGALLLGMVSEQVRFNWASMAAITGAGAGVVLLVTALSLPALWRLMRPDGLRTE